MHLKLIIVQFLALGQALKISNQTTSAVVQTNTTTNATVNLTANITADRKKKGEDEKNKTLKVTSKIQSQTWAEQKIVNPKGDKSVFTKIKPQGFKQKRLLKFNDDTYEAYGRSLDAAYKKNHWYDPMNDRVKHLEPFSQRKLFPKIVANKTWREFTVKTLDGKSAVNVLSYQDPSTKDKKLLPAHIQIHGGGNVGGDALNEADGFKNATFNTKAVYFFVEYRYAPFVKNPGQTEDVYVVIRELYNNADKYGIDKNRISVGGRSTGCTLALGAALMLQEKHEEHMLKNLYLFLPSINNIMWEDPQHSFDQKDWAPSLKFSYAKIQDFMKFVWEEASTDGSKKALDSVYVFPGKASQAQVNKLPPTIVFTAEYDFYRPDALDFAQKLTKAGKLLDFGDYGGCDHGFQFAEGDEKVTFMNDFTKLINTYL